MPIGNITYDTLLHAVATDIETNCYNINATKFNTLKNSYPYFMSDYTNKEVYKAPNGNNNYWSRIKINVSANYVTKISPDVYDDLKRFVATAGYTNIDSNIDAASFIGFFNTIVSFCSKYLRFATSQLTTESFLIYISGSEAADVFYKEPNDIVYADTIWDIIKVLRDRISTMVRCRPVLYTYDIT